MVHLWRLGLRAPSEYTKAMLVSVLLAREPAKKASLLHDRAGLRQTFLNMTSRLDGVMSRCKGAMEDCIPGGEYVYHSTRWRARKQCARLLLAKMVFLQCPLTTMSWTSWLAWCP